MIFLDTNVVSELVAPGGTEEVGSWYAANRSRLNLSIIVVAELLSGAELMRPSRVREAYLQSYGLVFASLPPPEPVDSFVAKAAAAMRGASRRSGVQLDLADALIAATAARHDAPLATRNIKDFEATGLTLIDPWNAP